MIIKAEMMKTKINVFFTLILLIAFCFPTLSFSQNARIKIDLDRKIGQVDKNLLGTSPSTSAGAFMAGFMSQARHCRMLMGCARM